MTHRERVLKTFRFESPDRVPYDLMEGVVWPEVMDHFRAAHGCRDGLEVLEFLDTDFRWAGMNYQAPEPAKTPSEPKEAQETPKSYSKQVMKGPLAAAETVAEVEAYGWPDPACWQPADYREVRRKWPAHALVFTPGWMPLFWAACEAFGMEAALINMHTRPALFEAFVQHQHEFYMDILARGLEAARGHCDICWLGDDYASQQAMLMNPKLWRKYIKPSLAKHVRLAREHDMLVLFHSCGAVREILGDLIELGVNALLVFQTTAVGMDAESIAREFGGRLAFYGGMDVQQLLSHGTVAEVEAAARANVRAFADCGGYIVANAHHCVATIKGQNIEAMCRAARECTFNLPA